MAVELNKADILPAAKTPPMVEGVKGSVNRGIIPELLFKELFSVLGVVR